MTLERSLYEEIGGGAAVRAAVDRFYEKVWADPDLTSYFETVDRDKLKRHQRAFLGMALGGPDPYAGEKLDRAHSGLGITHDAFDRVVAHLVSTLEELRVPIDVIHQIGAKLTPLRREIVGAGPAPA